MLRFFVVGFFSPNLSAQKKKKKGLGVNKKKYGSVKVTEITEEGPQLKHPSKTKEWRPTMMGLGNGGLL